MSFHNTPSGDHSGGGVRRYRPRSELSDEDEARVLGFTRAIEATWGVTFPEGYNDSLQLMAHLWHPLKVLHKPLFVHLASEGSMLVTHLCLQVRHPPSHALALPHRVRVLALVSAWAGPRRTGLDWATVCVLYAFLNDRAT